MNNREYNVKLVELSGTCPWAVIDNGRQVGAYDYRPDAVRAYNALIGQRSRAALVAKAEQRVSRFWSAVTPVKIGGEILYA